MAAEPFVTACYIVRDEEAVLAASILAVQDHVDDIVVYDTGSADGTRDLARSLGARVVDGWWDENFGAARNRALEYCRGIWVLSIDADEVLETSGSDLRELLAGGHDRDVWRLRVVSSDWDGSTQSASANVTRIFRRQDCRWDGALHEQLRSRHGRPLRPGDTGMILDHSGYTRIAMSERDKGRRNLRIAQSVVNGLSHADPRRNKALVDLGRSAQAAGDLDAAVEAYRELDLGTATSALAVWAAHSAVECAVGAGRPEDAALWMGRLRSWGEDGRALARLEALQAMKNEEWNRVTTLLGGIAGSFQDLRGVRISVESLLPSRVVAHHLAGEHEAAGRTLLEYLRTGSFDMPVHQVLTVAKAAGLGSAELLAALPPAADMVLLGQCQSLAFPSVASFLESFWVENRSRPATLLTAASLWPSMGVNDALTWSLRLREAGLADRCPLAAIAAAVGRHPFDRLIAWSVLFEIGEEGSVEGFTTVLSELEDGQLTLARAAVEPYSMRLAEALEVTPTT